jgi:hypothetical protein
VVLVGARLLLLLLQQPANVETLVVLVPPLLLLLMMEVVLVGARLLLQLLQQLPDLETLVVMVPPLLLLLLRVVLVGAQLLLMLQLVVVVLVGVRLLLLLFQQPADVETLVVLVPPLLPASMSKGLRRVVLHLLLLLHLWDLRLPELARAGLLVLVIALVGADMWLVVGPLVVLLYLPVLTRARLLRHGLLDREIQQVMALLEVLPQVPVSDSPMLPQPVGRRLTAVPVLQLLVPMGRVLLLPGGGLEMVGEMMLLEAGEMRLLQLVPMLELQGWNRA